LQNFAASVVDAEGGTSGTVEVAVALTGTSCFPAGASGSAMTGLGDTAGSSATTGLTAGDVAVEIGISVVDGSLSAVGSDIRSRAVSAAREPAR